MAAAKMIMATRNPNSVASFSQFYPFTCASASQPSRIAPQPPDLIRWVRREGGFVRPGLKISYKEAIGLCLVSSEEIAKGSDLIALPSHLPLCFKSTDPETDDSDPVLSRIARKVPEELWSMKLGLKLLQERAKSGSYWWPYIGNLPETFSTPIFFSGEEIKNLQYAPLFYQVNKRCRFLLDLEKEIMGILEGVEPENHPFKSQHVDASSLGWAMTAVSSRAFRLHGEALSDGKFSDIPMMLPVIDMCNHCFQPNAQIVQENRKMSSNMLVKVIAETEIEAGTPIMLNYGCLNNDLLLLDYGFVISSNPYDTIELKYDEVLLEAASMAAGVTMPNFSSPDPWQKQILCQLNLQGDSADLKVNLGGPELVDGRLLAALRVLSSDMETVKKHDLNVLRSLSVEAPTGISSEISVLRTVIALCVIALNHFPTKIMEDESLLKKESKGSMKLAIQFRMEKKSMIINIMRDLTKKIKILSEKTVVPQR